MADERLRSKSELKRLFTNLKRKGITDDMISILIDVLWRDKANMRTCGFETPGGTDAVISFIEATRTFTIAPLDPMVEGWKPRFGIYSWAQHATYHRMYETYELEIPDEEGLFILYFAANTETRVQELVSIKNPSSLEIERLYSEKVIVATIYWDANNGEAIHFGDNRHGSQWNPQIHWYLNRIFHARRKSGLEFANFVINGDGSSNIHAQFNISGGVMLHDDFEMSIPSSTSSISILYFSGASLPRFLSNPGYAVYTGARRICYNANQTSIQQLENGKYCMYHIFATNEILHAERKIISVMGTTQYDNSGAAWYGLNGELNDISRFIPMQGRCYLGSVILKADDAYANDIKAVIVGIGGESNTHPPVTIADDSKPYLLIDEKQELKINPWQPDYTETDINSPTYINNKPSLAKAFTDLSDVIPEDYIGKAKNVPIVTDDETMLDLIETEELFTTPALLTELSDCPASFAGYGGYILRVKLDETGIEFIAP